MNEVELVMKKKILLLGNHGFVIYNFRKELIKKLIELDYEVYVSLPKDKEKVEKMISWGCRFIETKVDGRGTNPFTDLKLLLHYLRKIKQIEPDVVLAYTIKPNIYGGLACRMLNIPCINTITGLGSGFKKESFLKKFLSFMYKVSMRKSACIFFQNSQDLNILLNNGTIKGDYSIVPGSGVNLDEYRYNELPEGKGNFIFIGRIMKDKGIDQFLEAAKKIKLKYPETSFKVIGYVEKNQGHYNKLIKEFQKEGYIDFLGYQSDVKPFIQDSQCIIQPSHGGEGLSNVLLESAAMGRILIASDIPGCRETINNSYNGFTFRPENTDDLIEKIEKFINLSRLEKIKMGLNSREKIKNEFDRDIVVKDYLTKIQELCNK